MHTTLAGWQYPLLIAVMYTVTAFGGMPWLLPLMGLVMFLVRRVYGLRILLLWSGYTLAIATLFQGIRFMVGRPRPLSAAAGYPSGHTVAAIALYGLLIYLWWPRQGSWRSWKPAVCGGLLLVIVGVGVSRLLLEKHWFSDVASAYLAGGFYLITCTWVLERRQTREGA
ncbi:MAG: phosphatase PAP2 family protein [Candidatus Entotheonellia bacterium]